MFSFESDYTNGAHEEILKALVTTNCEQVESYGEDKFSLSAKEKIKRALNDQNADVYFLAGGTQTNSLVISTTLKEYEGVVCASSGHINVHEAGAIEYTGHKVLTIPQREGKLCANALREYLKTFYEDNTREHTVFPGMAYISHPTEYGTLYSKDELIALRSVCDEYGMSLYLDGARLGYALESRYTDVSLEDIAKLCDVFYIGGTKVGALIGEALVFTKNNTPKHFLNCIKRRGAMLAKGRIIGVQFDTLFTDGLYFKISKNAIDRAEELKELFLSKGFELYINSPTNQQFVILENSYMNELKNKVGFSVWESLDSERTVVRFATSWATAKEDIQKLSEIL